MRMTKELNEVLIAVIVILFFIALSSAYWIISGDQSILQRDDNPRLVEEKIRIQRGIIFDRDYEILAMNETNTAGFSKRVYPVAASSPLTGYYSLRYGESGTELATDALLNGNYLDTDLQTYIETELIHQPLQGANIHTTFDTDLQHALTDLLGEQQGALVVMAIPSGEIWSMLSQPNYNANTLDQDWDSLLNNPDKALINRVFQGQYQAGTSIHIPLLAHAILSSYEMNQTFADSTDSFQIDDTMIACLYPPPTDTLTLEEAFLYGCSSPFIHLIEQEGIDSIFNTLKSFRIGENIVIQGYEKETPDSIKLNPNDSIEKIASGQGSQIISPLNLALMMGAIVNRGNAPYPHSISHFQDPNSNTWKELSASNAPEIAFMTENTAKVLKNIMNRFLEIHGGDKYDPSIGVYTGFAHSGNLGQTYFIGYIGNEDNPQAVIALVLEKQNDLDLTLALGLEALQISQDIMNSKTN